MQDHKYAMWHCRIALGLESRRFKGLRRKKPRKKIPEAKCDSDQEENKAAIPKIVPTTSSENQAKPKPTRRIVPTPIPSTSFAGEGFSSPPRQNKDASIAGQGQDKIIPKLEPTSSENQALVSPLRQVGVVKPLKIVLVRCKESPSEKHRAF